MHRETALDRSLWTTVLAIAVALVIASFAQRPLFGGDGEASGFGHQLTLWVAGGEAGSQTEAVARQVAACWQLDGRSTNVGVLAGSSAAAVVDFLRRPPRASDELLLLTSETLADVAHETEMANDPEGRERAERAERLLLRAPTVSLLASDPLMIATRPSSPPGDTGQLLAQMRERPAQPLIGVAEDAWSQGHLAALAQLAGVRGTMAFDSYGSTRDAVAGLDAGRVGVVLAPRSSLAGDVAAGRFRTLAWPGSDSPRAWVALLAPIGLESGQLTQLRRQAAALCPDGAWPRLLRADGLKPADNAAASSRDFVRAGLAEADRLQALAARVVRNY